MPHVLISSQDVVLEEDADKENNVISPSNFSDKLLEVGEGLRVKTQKKKDNFAVVRGGVGLDQTSSGGNDDVSLTNVLDFSTSSPEAKVNDLTTL